MANIEYKEWNMSPFQKLINKIIDSIETDPPVTRPLTFEDFIYAYQTGFAKLYVGDYGNMHKELKEVTKEEFLKLGWADFSEVERFGNWLIWENKSPAESRKCMLNIKNRVPIIYLIH